MSNPNPPKVFISHASEDKARFVADFAARLRANGIDAWYDNWEMIPGDSLVRKIFNEGLSNADSVIIVLSAISVKKPWVQEELDIAVVRKITQQCRIIPVIIEDCEVPTCLNATLWKRIANMSAYDGEFTEIVDSIYRRTNKPPLGPIPARITTSPMFTMAGLEQIDNGIVGGLCEMSTESQSRKLDRLERLDRFIDDQYTDRQVENSLLFLEGKGLIRLVKGSRGGFRGGRVHFAEVMLSTYDKYARTKWPDYEDAMKQIMAGIVNKNWKNSSDTECIGFEKRLRHHILEVLEARGYIGMVPTSHGYVLHSPSVELQRIVEKL